MFKKISSLAIVSLLSFHANANWVGGVGYTNVSDDSDNLEVDLGAITGSVGYKFQNTEAFSIRPELTLGVGIRDDDIFRIEVSLKRFIAISVRGEYELSEKVYVYAAPTYANLEIEASRGSISASEDDWEFGFGAGIGYVFSENTSAEVSYQTFDGTDVVNVGLKFSF